MHEMSLAQSLLTLVRQELEKHGSPKLAGVTVRRGALANVVPEALDMAFEVLTAGTDLEGVTLEQVEEPVRLACGGCGKEFLPEASAAARFSPCPFCGEELGHLVLAGKELYLDHLDVE
jgi:hydrogenase nickel incorporation protein HypA/HybF